MLPHSLDPNKKLMNVASARENTMNNIKISENEKVAYLSKPACSWDIIASTPSDWSHNNRLISSTHERQRCNLSYRRPLIKEGRIILN